MSTDSATQPQRRTKNQNLGFACDHFCNQRANSVSVSSPAARDSSITTVSGSGGFKHPAVDLQKHRRDSQRHPLVAVHERIVADNPVTVARRLFEYRIVLFIFETVSPPLAIQPAIAGSGNGTSASSSMPVWNCSTVSATVSGFPKADPHAGCCGEGGLEARPYPIGQARLEWHGGYRKYFIWDAG